MIFLCGFSFSGLFLVFCFVYFVVGGDSVGFFPTTERSEQVVLALVI